MALSCDFLVANRCSLGEDSAEDVRLHVFFPGQNGVVAAVLAGRQLGFVHVEVRGRHDSLSIHAQTRPMPSAIVPVPNVLVSERANVNAIPTRDAVTEFARVRRPIGLQLHTRPVLLAIRHST